MKKYISYSLAALLIILFSFVTTTKIFSQTNQEGSKTETTDSVTTMPNGTSSYVKGVTAGRAKALVGVAAGLISLVIGWWAKARSAKGTSSVRTSVVVALVLGITGIVLSIVHLSTSAGAVFGSGSGKAGAIFALLLSLIGMTLGWQALRSRKTA
jgi:hypothetical protein